MRYPALRLFMAASYLVALLVAIVAYRTMAAQYGSFVAVLSAILASLLLLAVADLLRLAMDVESGIRSLCQLRPEQTPAPAAESDGTDKVLAAYDRLDAAANNMIDRAIQKARGAKPGSSPPDSGA